MTDAFIMLGTESDVDNSTNFAYENCLWGSANASLVYRTVEKILQQEVLPPNPNFWGGVRYLDISAYDASLPVGIFLWLESTLSALEIQLQNKMKLIVNDPAYITSNGDSSRLRACTNYNIGVLRESCPRSISPSVTVCDKSGEILKPTDVGGAVDIVFDRLGGLWYKSDETLKSLEEYLFNMAHLLKPNGKLIFDAYLPESEVKDPVFSTYYRLLLKIGSSRSLNAFFRSLGFSTQRVGDFVTKFSSSAPADSTYSLFVATKI